MSRWIPCKDCGAEHLDLEEPYCPFPPPPTPAPEEPDPVKEAAYRLSLICGHGPFSSAGDCSECKVPIIVDLYAKGIEEGRRRERERARRPGQVGTVVSTADCPTCLVTAGRPCVRQVLGVPWQYRTVSPHAARRRRAADIAAAIREPHKE